MYYNPLQLQHLTGPGMCLRVRLDEEFSHGMGESSFTLLQKIIVQDTPQHTLFQRAVVNKHFPLHLNIHPNDVIEVVL